MPGSSYRIVLNMSAEQIRYVFPDGQVPGLFVFGNMEVSGPSASVLELRPWEARIYQA